MADENTVSAPAEVSAVTSEIAELTGLSAPSQPASPEPAPATVQEPASAAPSASPAAPGIRPDERSAQAPTAAPASEPPVPVREFTVDGRKFTPETLAEAIRRDPEMAHRFATRAEQTAHYQSKYERLLEERAAPQPQQPAQAPVTPEQASQQRRIVQAQLKAHYDPIAKQLAAEGQIEPDLVDLYPEAVTGMLYMRDSIQGMAARLSELEASLSQGVRVNTANAARAEFNSMMDEVASGGEIFADLAKPEERQGFEEFLVQQVNPLGKVVNVPFLRQMYAAWKSDVLLAGLREAGKRQQAEDARRRTQAAGASAGPRPAAAPAPTEQEAQIRELITL